MQQIQALRKQYETLMVAYREFVGIRGVCNVGTMRNLARMAYSAAAAVQAAIQRLMQSPIHRFCCACKDVMQALGGVLMALGIS